MTTRTVSVALKLAVSDFIANSRKVPAVIKGIGSEIDGLAKNSKNQFNDMTTAAGAMGLGLLGAFTLIAKSAMDFDKQMSEVGAVSSATGQDLDKLREAAISAGQATVFSAADAAQAEAELAKAGVSTSDILAGALSGSLALAAAGSLDLADAATDAAQAMNIFNLSGSQVGHIADVLAAGANKSAADVKSLADGMKQGGQVAAMTGLTLEDTVGTLAAFADNALVGSDAGTSLKTMLQALQAPSGVTAKLMAQLGINAYDTSGNFIGIVNLAGQLQRQLGDLSAAERAHAMAQIFGSDATRSANVLYKLGASGLQDYITSVDDTGAAEEVARQKMNNLSGDVENLKGSIETLTISTGEGVQSGLRGMAQAATRAVNSFGLMPPVLSEVGTAVAGIVGVGILGGSAFAKIKAKSDELQESLTNMGPAGAKAAAGLGAMTRFAGKLAIGLAVLQTASAAFGTTIDPLTSKTAKDLEQLGATGQATGIELKHLSYDIGTIGSGGMTKFGNAIAGTIESMTGTGNVFDESLTHAQQRISAIDQGLAALVANGKASEAAQAFGKLREEADKQGISLWDLNNALPNYAAALDGVASGEIKAGDAAGDQADATGKLATSIEEAIGKAHGLVDILDQLNGGNITWIKAQSELQAAFDAATKAIKDNGKTVTAHNTVIDLGTEKGRANMAALLAIADASKVVAQSSLDQTHNQAAANDVLEDGRQHLYENARQMGLTKDAAWALVDQLLKIPPVNAPVTLTGITKAFKQIGDLKYEIDTIPSGKTVNVKIQYHSNSPGGHGSTAMADRWGGAYEHAATGLLRDANVYSARNPGRYMIAEPATQGEAFVPKSGNYGRSMSILGQAASWYGASVVPGGMGGGGGGGSVNVHFSADPVAAAAMQTAQIRATVQGHGGDVQKAYGTT